MKGRREGYLYSLNEGVVLGGNLKTLEILVQGRLKNNYVCRKCSVEEVAKMRLDLHDNASLDVHVRMQKV